MSVRQRGCLYLLVGLGFAILFCGIIPFVIMPGAGVAMALPVIEVPGESVIYDFLPGFNLTNTLLGTLFADVMILIYIFVSRRASKNWTQEVPGRWQSLVERITEAMRNFFYGLAGDKLNTIPYLFALAATIMTFLLAANWMKLFPGVESVGIMHCTHPGLVGYPRYEGALGVYTYYVNAPLDAGKKATLDDEHACYDYKTGKIDEAAKEEARLHAEELGAEIAELEEHGEEVPAELREEWLFARTESHFAHAAFTLPEAELDRLDAGGEPSIEPYTFSVTPFFRGPATDLSLTIALALISMIMVQVYGVMALGPAYFEKFVNISAIGNLGKRPLGAIDFVVGLIEIISEIGKVISLAFRLFGNLFAGGIVLIVISFLVAMIVPMVVYGLELIIGSVQALVFATLTLVFVSQAVVSHHHDDEHHDEGHAESH